MTGRALFEAWCVPGAAYWDGLLPEQKAKWNRVAEAVGEYVNDRCMEAWWEGREA